MKMNNSIHYGKILSLEVELKEYKGL